MSKPVNPNTPDQSASRAAMREARQAWRALSEEQRDGYHAYAREHAKRIGEEEYKRLVGWENSLASTGHLRHAYGQADDEDAMACQLGA